LINPDKRRGFGQHVVSVLDTFGNRTEQLYGYFGLVGIGKRWVDVANVDWYLILDEGGVSVGELIFRGDKK
jgi:hypothetical protein